MSKSKVYKKKNKQASAKIFVVLAVILVVLIAIVVALTSIENAKYNNLLEDYTQHEYGERQNVKLQKAADSTSGTTVYVSDNYYYYPDDNVIYDMTKNTATTEAFEAKLTEVAGDLGSVAQAYYTVYTDGADFGKDYGYLQIEASYAGVIGGKEAVAQKVYDFVTALGEEYNVCGLYFTYTDSEAFYMSVINVADKETVTLEKITENMNSMELTSVAGAEIVVDEGEAEAQGEAEEAAE